MSQKRRTAHRITGHLAVALLALGGLLAPAAPAGAGGQHLGQVPDMAFLQPEDTGGFSGRRLDADVRPELRPPLPCGKARYRSQQKLQASGAMAYSYPVPGFHTVLIENLAGHRGDGAARYLTELRRTVTAPGCTDRDGRWTLLDRAVAGPDSVLIRRQEKIIDYGGNPKIQTTYLVVARTGRMVATLVDIGWEDGDGHQETVRALAGPALRRAAASAGLLLRYRATSLGTGVWARSMNDRGRILGHHTVYTPVPAASW